MIVTVDEKSDVGRFVTARNLARQYDFLHTAFVVWEENLQLSVSHRFIQELNFYATQFLSTRSGQYRQEDVVINHTDHQPPEWKHVESLMNGFLEKFMAVFDRADPVELAAYVLWRVNWIHPFVQGNGRTARALSYFVLCQKFKLWLPGLPIIPEQIRATRDEYCELLRRADKEITKEGTTNTKPIEQYIGRLLKKQLGS